MGTRLYYVWRLMCITDNRNRCPCCNKSLKHIYSEEYKECFERFLNNFKEMMPPELIAKYINETS